MISEQSTSSESILTLETNVLRLPTLQNHKASRLIPALDSENKQHQLFLEDSAVVMEHRGRRG